MDLLIHDIAAACERDAAIDYDVNDRAFLSDLARREPVYRFRCGRVDLDLHDSVRHDRDDD